jgi:hypothetical protein
LQSKSSSVNVEEGPFSKQELRLMRVKFSFPVVAVSAVAMLGPLATLAAFGQGKPPADAEKAPAQVIAPAVAPPELRTDVPASTAPMNAPIIVQELADFRPTDVKFSLDALVDILQDRRHEGWVLAAYPDPKTSRPLIGAGFSLDLPAREHPQTDALNSHPFLEPASAALWQTAGLDGARLETILAQYAQNLEKWKAKKFRKKIRDLAPQITEEDANALLRIGVVQAIYNARGYCRNFDRLSASQQMALTQLVYQMGFNLQEFNQFLGLINSDAALPQADEAVVDASPDGGYWKAVQGSLIQSQWARLYRTRAVSVIAMLDPQYSDAPAMAEHRISAILRPAVVHRRRGHAAASLQDASLTKPGGHGLAKKPRHSRSSKTRRK